jgi:hypothetical protein
MNPISLAISFFARGRDFANVQAFKPAWNGHFLAFLHPFGKDARTFVKSARSAQLTGTCTLERLKSRVGEKAVLARPAARDWEGEPPPMERHNRGGFSQMTNAQRVREWLDDGLYEYRGDLDGELDVDRATDELRQAGYEVFFLPEKYGGRLGQPSSIFCLLLVAK